TAPCSPSAQLSGTTDVADDGTTISISNGPGNGVLAINHFGAVATTCVGAGTTPSCGLSPPIFPASLSATTFDDVEGVSGDAQEQRPFVAGTTNNDIVAYSGATAATCAAEGGGMGCTAAHGLHHPRQMALAAPASGPRQLYAATDDGVAWFNVDGPVTFAGC